MDNVTLELFRLKNEKISELERENRKLKVRIKQLEKMEKAIYEIVKKYVDEVRKDLN